jgi:hypothetical protein
MQTGDAANNDLQQEQPDMGGSSPLTASVSNGTKPHMHVPPRIDPDMYQADVPDWTPPEGGTISILFCLGYATLSPSKLSR